MMSWFVDDAIKQNMKTTDVYADAAPKSAKVLRRGLHWLKKADRFRVELPLIPHGLEERFAAHMERYAHGFNLPSKFALVEYEHGGNYDMKPDLTRALSTKRIALCVQLDSIHAVDAASISKFERDPNDHGGILIWSLNYFDEKREWEFAPGAAIIPRSQVTEFLSKQDGVSRSAAILRWLKRRCIASRSPAVLQVIYQEMLPEICAKLGKEHRARAIRETNMDAIWVALGFFSSFGCKNVRFDADARSASVIKKGINVPVLFDPFHGRRESTFTGAPVWVQESSLHV